MSTATLELLMMMMIRMCRTETPTEPKEKNPKFSEPSVIFCRDFLKKKTKTIRVAEITTPGSITKKNTTQQQQQQRNKMVEQVFFFSF